jgi:Tfp pilus assembly protein PilF
MDECRGSQQGLQAGFAEETGTSNSVIRSFDGVTSAKPTNPIRKSLGVARRIAHVAILASLASGCQQTLTPTPTPNPLSGQNPADVKYYPSDEPVRLGIQRFNEGNFALAQHYFQDAVEGTPNDVTAWVGLAASYDRLGRFDLADRAYAAAVKLKGNTASILNNEGYSYMLRGDLIRARTKFEAALKLDPNNQTTLNNLQLLNSSIGYVQRAVNGEPCGSVDCGGGQ